MTREILVKAGNKKSSAHSGTSEKLNPCIASIKTPIFFKVSQSQNIQTRWLHCDFLTEAGNYKKYINKLKMEKHSIWVAFWNNDRLLNSLDESNCKFLGQADNHVQQQCIGTWIESIANSLFTSLLHPDIMNVGHLKWGNDHSSLFGGDAFKQIT